VASTRFGLNARTIVLSAVLASAVAATSTFVVGNFAQAATGHAVLRSSAQPVSAQLLAEPSTPAQVRTKLTALSHASEQLSEQLNEARIVLQQDQVAADQAKIAAALDHANLVAAQQELAQSLSQQYRAASFSRTAALLSSPSGQSYIDTVQSLNFISAHQAAVEQQATVASAQAQQAQTAAATATAAALSQRDALVAQQAALKAQATKYNDLLATLTAAALKSYYASTAATPVQVQELSAAPVPAPSARAAVVIAAARAELGKPYVYGAAGPSSFDCSGLTMWAFAAAGVSLPHNAAAQYGYGTHIAESQLEPGDLVFFYSPISHVGIYIGNGLMIHAPTSGDVVKIAPVFGAGEYAGATRIS
jgi:cell wall-associated NlpC family hydrolase